MKFKKIIAVIGGTLLLGASMGAVVANTNTYPTPFMQDGNADVAIVYGTNSAPSDLVAANKISDNLKSIFDEVYDSTSTGDFTSSLGITENEVELGNDIAGEGKLRAILTDNQVPSLIDDKIYWDDGVNTKTSFNVHEEILLGDMSLKTTLDERDLNSTALTNNKALEYKYIFEEDLNTNLIGTDDADVLKVSILGIEYEVEEFGTDYITVSTSKENILKTGESVSIDGLTITVEDIFEGVVQINNELIKEGRTETVNGLKVNVVSIAYHSSETLSSKVILRVGKEISTTYNDGDAYIGEDETDPVWIWTIEKPGKESGFIGVHYDQKEVDSDDNLVYVGGSYTLPENYATVSFDKLTDVDYEDFEVSFDDSKDLYIAETNGGEMYEDANVVILSGSQEDSFLVDVIDKETDTLYLKYNSEAEIVINNNGVWNSTSEEWEGNTTTILEGVDVFYSDVNKDYSDSVKPRFAFTLTEGGDVGTLVYEDTELDISIDERTLSIGELSIELNPTGEFTHLGVDSEIAEDNELRINTKNVGDEDEDVLSHNGLIIYNSESNAEDDEVIFGVPSEQVYAMISVLGIGEDVVDETVPQFGSIIVKDTEISSVSSKNLIVVGGSCINTVAAKLLGSDVPLCGADWTAKTNVGAGQFLVKEYASPYDSGKVALLVAGYEAGDTTAAADTLIV